MGNYILWSDVDADFSKAKETIYGLFGEKNVGGDHSIDMTFHFILSNEQLRKLKGQKEQYRFEMGSLFEYDEESNSYIHCFKDAYVKTKKTAIKRYEENKLNEFLYDDKNGPCENYGMSVC